MAKAPEMHYWTGYGTLCSLDNSRQQKPTHTDEKQQVTCKHCLYLIWLNKSKSQEGKR